MRASSIFKLYLSIHLLYFTFLTLSVYFFSNISYRPANVMSCHELNEQNEAGDDKVDNYKDKVGNQIMSPRNFDSLRISINGI